MPSTHPNIPQPPDPALSPAFRQLEARFADLGPVSPEEFDAIRSAFREKKVRKNEFLLHTGERCQHFYFVYKGCIRFFKVSEAGDESTRYFAFEDTFGSTLVSLIEGSASPEHIQAVEPSHLLAIHRDDFYRLVDTSQPFQRVYRMVLENAYITSQQRIYGFQTMTALEKLQWLLERHPQILSRLSSRLVASYLGVSPFTLSRLKAEL